MRTVLLTLILLTSLSTAYAQCNEIFISEYVEGWSNNKAIELYNPTDQSIDLSEYRLERYSNGSTSADPNQRLELEGTIPPLSVWVIVIDKRNPDGTGQEAPVWDELQEKADIFMCPEYVENNAMYFNGNDALVLRKNNVVIDIFGKLGQDPGAPVDGGGWNNVPPAYTWTANLEVAWTADHTLIRKSTVEVGNDDSTIPDPFDVSAQWDSLPANTFENLGSHICICGNVTNVEEQQESEMALNLFPNPSETGMLRLNSDATISRVRVLSIDGKLVHEEQINALNVELNLSELPAGSYLIQAFDQNNRATRRTFIRQ